jgi:P-type Cu2+ transporter
MDACVSHCAHCGLPVPYDSTGGAEFCCIGCKSAYALVRDLGLERYYQLREINPDLRPLRPDEGAPPVDVADRAVQIDQGTWRLNLMVEGLHCAACVWLIETVLRREPGITRARINMSTHRLVLEWSGSPADANSPIAQVERLGYRLVPFDAQALGQAGRAEERALLRALAVAGFAAGNVMLLSIAVWAGAFGDMGPATRDLLHWVSALIAMPAIAYAGRPFFRAIPGFVRQRAITMDLPISAAIILATAMSLFEVIRGGEHVYFDSAVTLLFFLLVGRYLDRRARGRARSAVEHLLALGAQAVTVIEAGIRRMIAPHDVKPGMTVLVAAGERVAVDGHVEQGRSDLDNSLITGESAPVAVEPGARVFAGTLNVTGPLQLSVDSVGEKTVLAEIVRLMEAAEQGRARYVALADRVARAYAPLVHGLALATFLGWWLIPEAGWQIALLNGIAVLIITCPCALGLAVPMVQVVAAGRLLKQGIFLKSATALERLARVDTVVFDKTGTLTLGRPKLVEDSDRPDALRRAASLAAASRHPLAQALCAACPGVTAANEVEEFPGQGLRGRIAGKDVLLGRREWCGLPASRDHGDGTASELWFCEDGAPPLRFRFSDTVRSDAAFVVEALRRRGLEVTLLSGDIGPVVGKVADELGIEDWQAGCTPKDKTVRLEALALAGRKVLMVGDGLNDAPALSAAYVSASPASAADISQTAADVVFQGDRLAPVLEILYVAHRADRLVKQNIGLALVYNATTVPLAVLGFVTPLIAAAAMSSSSILVIGNALRLSLKRR